MCTSRDTSICSSHAMSASNTMVDTVLWWTAACSSSKVETAAFVGSNVTDVGANVDVGYGVGDRVYARAPVTRRRRNHHAMV